MTWAAIGRLCAALVALVAVVGASRASRGLSALLVLGALLGAARASTAFVLAPQIERFPTRTSDHLVDALLAAWPDARVIVASASDPLRGALGSALRAAWPDACVFTAGDEAAAGSIADAVRDGRCAQALVAVDPNRRARVAGALSARLDGAVVLDAHVNPHPDGTRWAAQQSTPLEIRELTVVPRSEPSGAAGGLYVWVARPL